MYSYVKKGGLSKAHTIISGVLRYRGFCEVMSAFLELGLFRKVPVDLPNDGTGFSFRDVIQTLLLETSPNLLNISLGNGRAKNQQQLHLIFDSAFLDTIAEVLLTLGMQEDVEFCTKLIIKALNNKNNVGLPEKRRTQKVKTILKACKFLNVFDSEAKVTYATAPLLHAVNIFRR